MNSRIIEELMEKDGYISGEELSVKLGVSRTAIWKHIEELRRKGFKIESSSRKGYILKKSTEELNSIIIKKSLDTCFIGKDIEIFETIDSTNDEAKRRASNSFENGLVILSEEQKAGRGRLGRIWESQKSKGIFMSILLKPTNLEPNHGSRLTLIAAVAIVKAIEKQLVREQEDVVITTNEKRLNLTKNKVLGHSIGHSIENSIENKLSIKWPNDILFDGKKICGILTEMSADIDRIHWLILGIGVNVLNNSEDFPEELSNIATSLKIATGETFDRNILIADILNILEELYLPFEKNGEIKHILDFYRDRSLVADRKLLIHRRGEITECVGITVTDEGYLRVRHIDGEIEDVYFGEVTVRLDAS